MIYDFKVKKTNGEEILLEKYKGKVLLIVNTASGCGFTPQYEGLQKIYDEYKDKGFEILDFPCNQFFQQAPGSDAELSSFCKLTYGTTFETFAKIEVNGENASDLYKFLKSEAPQAEEDEESKLLYGKLEDLGFKTDGEDIKWNFTKFLVDFFAEWCGPCKMISPILDELQAEFEDKINIIKVNVDNSMDIAEQYNISNIPALVLLKKGQEVQRLIGFSPKQVIKENIEKHL